MGARLMLLALLLGSGGDPPLPATTNNGESAIGRWACQQTYTEFDQFGNRSSGHTTEFQMDVRQSGEYELGGTIWGPSGGTPFQSSGRWQLQHTTFNATGTITQTDMFGTTELPFVLIGTLSPDGASMSSQQDVPNANQTGILSRFLQHCQKQV